MQLGRFLGLDRADLAHGTRLAFAAWLAYALAALLHIDNAYWAAMPVWVVAQPAKGLLIERGFFRFVGTILGAGAGFGIVQLGFGPYPTLLLLGVWISCSAMLVHILRGVHGYGALLAGITAAVVVLPSILRPEHTTDLAVARVECTLIGVVIVTLVTGLWTPASPRQEFYSRVRRLAGEAIAFALAPPAEPADARERQMLREISEVQANVSLVSAGSIEGYRRLHHVDALIVAALDVMAVGHRLAERLRRDKATCAFLTADAARQAADDLLAVPFQAPAETQALLSRFGYIDADLAKAVQRLVAADKAFETEPSGADARSFGRKAIYLAPHRDARLAAEIGLVTGAATFLAALLGHVSGWQTGELAALGVCIFSMILGATSAPHMVAPTLLKGVGAGVAAALLYRVAIQPQVTTPTELLLSIAPFLLLGGLARASRKTAGPALDANMCFLLASQAALPAVTDRAVIMNQAAALMLGASLVSVGFMLLPPMANRRTTLIARAIGADLLRMLKDRRTGDQAPQTERIRRQILRLSLHLDKAALPGFRSGWSLLGALNLADAIASLRSISMQRILDPTASTAIREAKASLRSMFEDPVGVAYSLERQAGLLADEEVADLLCDAASALRASRSLLSYVADSAPARRSSSSVVAD